MKEKIVLAYGNKDTGKRWQNLLESLDFHVILTQDSEGIFEEISHESPEMLLMSEHLLDLSALEVLTQLGMNQPFPILIMKQFPNTELTVAAFTSGANDVVSEEISIDELESRIRNLMRLFWRFADGYMKELQYEDLQLELKSRKVYRGDQLIKLTPKEFDLLRYLMKRAGIVCEREEILQEVWGYDFSTGTNVVDVYIRHLRTKVDKGQAKKLIHTVRGKGYMVN
ncbi:DNA-binding response regulator, OmpR family, contains REC and winged-helix (wHTH) domain [Fontibacillus panacisegetis]|uniref:DNA-binding response regulator, OmpR family, contains REC and winged-helix (WHTH) domain n=1 Tax=Fontibacillus panacisegetis TaxID=670482 RepID=A0A1G7GL26_9BACL|nr:response regulator transcription factor [Fontibacillus panacisegetis]SDE88837.1 DNA-binding response regulator, OmpR family, contains REC and winged-helix (wHTH) domain [Fontibacillus panacisegetis]